MGMHAVPTLWPGSTVACLATGPSLTAEDCAYLRGKCHMIAINDAWKLAPWADVLYSSDRRWWPYYQGVPQFQGLKYGVGSGSGINRKANGFNGYPEIRVLRNTGYEGIETQPIGLRTGSNSGYAAINLAIHFGAKRILLLGYNMGKVANKAHFFGDHPAGLSQTQSAYPRFRRLFETMVKPLQELGIEVLNCTESSSLRCFPHARLADVLPSTAVKTDSYSPQPLKSREAIRLGGTPDTTDHSATHMVTP